MEKTDRLGGEIEAHLQMFYEEAHFFQGNRSSDVFLPYCLLVRTQNLHDPHERPTFPSPLFKACVNPSHT